MIPAKNNRRKFLFSHEQTALIEEIGGLKDDDVVNQERYCDEGSESSASTCT
jgi:hypothetical protein